MLYLMKLEVKKFRLHKYLKGVIISIVTLIGLNILMLRTSANEGELMFQNAHIAVSFFDALIRAVFLIFSSVILSKIVIEEYRKKTIQLMYCYPISRKKLIISKLSIIYLFTVITILLADVIIIPLLSILSANFHWLPETITLSLLIGMVPSMLLGAVFSGFVSLIPFYVAMRKKSVSSAIVTAIIAATLLISSMGDVPYQQYFLRIVIAGGISMLFVMLTFRKKINEVQEEDI